MRNDYERYSAVMVRWSRFEAEPEVINREAQFRTDPQRWPLENHQSNEGGEGELWEGKWLHSDFKNVALSHVYKMFDQMIETGGLDQ